MDGTEDIASYESEVIENVETRSSVLSVFIYVILRVISLFIFLAVALFIKDPRLVLAIVIGNRLVIFFVNKNFSGLQLVGLKWELLFTPNEKGNFLEYYIRPDLSIPNSCQSYTFWLGFFVSMIFWTCMSIFLVIFFEFSKSLASFLSCLLDVLNFYFFAQALAHQKQLNDSKPIRVLESSSSGEAEP